MTYFDFINDPDCSKLTPKTALEIMETAKNMMDTEMLYTIIDGFHLIHGVTLEDVYEANKYIAGLEAAERRKSQ